MDRLRFRDEGLTIDQIQTNNDLIITNSYEIIYDRSIEIYSFNTLCELLPIDNNSLITTAFSIGAPLSFIIPLFYSNLSRSDKIKDDPSIEIEGVKINGEEINIFILIREFLKPNRIFSKDKAIEYVKSRYNKTNGSLNHNGIKAVINSLIEKNLIVEGSILTRNEIFLNSNRKQIYDFIKENPGVHRNKIARKLGFSTYLINWHASMLIKFNLVRQQKLSNYTSYFDSSLRQENDLLLHTISRDKCIRIINFLKKKEEGITKNQISKALNMHFNTVSKYINKMDNFSLLERKKINNIEYISLNYNSLKLLKTNL